MSKPKITLCSARFDFNGDFTEWCDKRNTCERYLSFINWPKGEPVSVRVDMGRPDCPHYIEAKPKAEQHCLIVTRRKHGVWQARRHIYYSEALANAALELIKAHKKKVITINLGE